MQNLRRLPFKRLVSKNVQRLEIFLASRFRLILQKNVSGVKSVSLNILHLVLNWRKNRLNIIFLTWPFPLLKKMFPLTDIRYCCRVKRKQRSSVLKARVSNWKMATTTRRSKYSVRTRCGCTMVTLYQRITWYKDAGGVSYW